MEQVYSIVKSIVIYLILISFLMNLIGNSGFKKYIEIFSGMLLILILISPISNLLKQGLSFNYHYDQNQFSVESREFERDLTEMEEGKKEQIISNYKGQMKDGIQTILKEYSLLLDQIYIDLEEDLTAEQYGEVLNLSIEASYTNNPSKKEKKIVISDISEITINEKSDQEVIPDIPSPLEIKVIEKIVSVYGISADRISISITE